MKIDVKTLKSGDKIYWSEGSKISSGEFVEILNPILDLHSIRVKCNGKEDDILDIFLIPKEEYEKAKESAVKPIKEKKIIEKTYSPKANIKGIEYLLSQEGLTIHKGDKWYKYHIGETIIEYKGPIKDLFEPLKNGGLQAMIDFSKNNQDAKKEKKEKNKKISSSFEPKANLKGLEFLLSQNDYSIERTKERWYRYILKKEKDSFKFDYRGPVKDLFETLNKKGIESFLKMNQFEG